MSASAVRVLWSSVLLLAVIGAVGLTCAAGCERRAAPVVPSGHVRVVALAPAFAQMLRASGAGRALVGRHAYDAWSEASLAVCGDQAGVDYERLVALLPTHIVVQRDATPTAPRLVKLAAERGWVLIELPLLTLGDVERAGERMAALAREAGAVQVERAGAFAALKVPEGGTFSGTVLLLHGIDPPTALGPGSYHYELLVRVGGVPALKTGGPYVTLDAESVARLNPGAIVLIQPTRVGLARVGPARVGPALAGGESAPARGPEHQQSTRAEAIKRLGVLAKLDLEAVRAGRVWLIDDEMALVPGTNLAATGGELSAVLQRWREDQ